MDDQTDPNDVNNALPDERGTGIFLVPDVKNGQLGAATKVHVAELTYADCKARGQFTIAFKWVPSSVMSELLLMQMPCGGQCVTTCVKKGCVCNQKTGFCQ